ncbi:MAG TPA: DUF1186 domain-containing protein [Planctomycetaceae bacterium]|nr:DUF1186 domain-containing protein [Planctomycetaceae bacterium]
MRLPFITMNRLVEERAAEDEEYRRQLRRYEKRTLSDGRSLPDEALVEKLRSLGVSIDREWLDLASRKSPSAEALFRLVMERARENIPAREEDWVWIALTCLWERWFPERPNLEMLDDQVQAGYNAHRQDRRADAVRHWSQAWRSVQQLMASFAITTIEEFDERMGGTQSVSDWIQDLSTELAWAATRDRAFGHERLALCRSVLDMAARSKHDSSLVDGFRRGLAESHADLGETETVDALYTRWLAEDPRWGWGWIGWSDIYVDLSATADRRSPEKAEQILKQGLAVPDVNDREDICDRLVLLYEGTGRCDEAAALRKESGHPDESDNAPRRFDGGSEPVDDELSLDEIIAEIDADYTGVLPERALRAAQRRRAEIAPRLIELIRQATRTVRDGEAPEGEGHVFALYLLAEFQAREALPVILEAVSLPDDWPFELFGDAITEDLASILAELAADSPQVLADLIANDSLNEFVRAQAACTYLYLVRDGRMTRDEAVRLLHGQLREAIARYDGEGCSFLVEALADYAPREALDDIRTAFRERLVDEWMSSLEEIERSVAEGDGGFARALERCRPTGVQDTVEEFRSWAGYQDPEPDEWESDEDEDDDEWDEFEDDEDDFESEEIDFGDEGDGSVGHFFDPAHVSRPRETITIRNTAPRAGRNDPCPCGSGKKYKKCCGAS